LDISGNVGSLTGVDLVVRGDRFARRARAYTDSPSDTITFQPEAVLQLTPGAYNRVVLNYNFRHTGTRRSQIHLVDMDSKELISAWLLSASATAPAVLRTYDVDVPLGRDVNKKIIFQNPWRIPKRFTVRFINDNRACIVKMCNVQNTLTVHPSYD
jgi:hypothetical protein